MSANVLPAAKALLDSLSGLDARLYSGEDAAKGAEILARTEKVCAAKRAEFAARAAECGAHRDKGFSSPSEWVARLTGGSSGEARRDLETAVALDELPATKGDVEAGSLSLAEAQEIVKTEKVCPGSEAELRKIAKRRGLRALKEAAKRKRLAAKDPVDLRARQEAAQEVRHWTDELGMVCLFARLLPEVGVPILSKLEAGTDRIWRAGDEETRKLPRERLAAQAFVEMLDGKGRGVTTRSDLVVVWDVRNDTAHVPGVGPLTIEAVRDLAKHAFLTAVTHDGVKVDTIKRFGKYIPPELRLLLAIGDPPDFEGAVCIDCGRRWHLQNDHFDPRANGGPTSFENLGPRCPPCHRIKTERDRKAGLLKGNKKVARDPP